MAIPILFCILIIADQVAKHLASVWCLLPINVIDGFMAFTYVENRGAAFGIMQNMQPLFVFMSILYASAAAIFLTLNDRRLRPTLKVGGWLTVTGAVGNLIDRMINGYVIDFVYIYRINFPVFNLADVYLTVGAVIVIIGLIFGARSDKSEGQHDING